MPQTPCTPMTKKALPHMAFCLARAYSLFVRPCIAKAGSATPYSLYPCSQHPKTAKVWGKNPGRLPGTLFAKPLFGGLSVCMLPLCLFIFLACTGMAEAAQGMTVPDIQLSLSGGTDAPEKVSLGLEILFLLTILSLAPAIIMTVTSFTRIIVVFHFVRQALGIQQVPPNQVLVSLAIFLSVAIMLPVGKTINSEALQPYLEEKIGFPQALEKAEAPLREFMFAHTREKDLSIFYSITKMDRPQTKEDVPTTSLAAAFIISELKTGFIIGFLIYIPFLIVDMVVSSILLAMGMMMLPPMMVSMPFKLLLFVMVDGWTLLVGSLVNSFIF